jgi:hypothetical protein
LNEIFTAFETTIKVFDINFKNLSIVHLNSRIASIAQHPSSYEIFDILSNWQIFL